MRVGGLPVAVFLLSLLLGGLAVLVQFLASLDRVQPLGHWRSPLSCPAPRRGPSPAVSGWSSCSAGHGSGIAPAGSCRRRSAPCCLCRTGVGTSTTCPVFSTPSWEDW